ncbi:hypothetical protein, partial [Micromonospora sp. NPDC051296]|uniref:hypothetical protein n=1 Tax=Micromonospora sp. NPDC051296 TaxID=3155046 RepID=UPI00342FC82F
PEPIFTPSTKAPMGEHDEPMTFTEVVDKVGAEAADTLRHLRTELLLAVDRLRTLLINADDITGPATTVSGNVKTITDLAGEYRQARDRIDALIADTARTSYAQAHLGQVVRRRYVNPGDTVPVVLPHTDYCRRESLAGRPTLIQVGTSDARLRPPGSVNPLRLSHTDAGIYRDPTDNRLYTLRSADDTGR